MTNFSILIGHNRHNLYKHSIPNEKKHRTCYITSEKQNVSSEKRIVFLKPCSVREIEPSVY